jgi:hypothetical protein
MRQSRDSTLLGRKTVSEKYSLSTFQACPESTEGPARFAD